MKGATDNQWLKISCLSTTIKRAVLDTNLPPLVPIPLHHDQIYQHFAAIANDKYSALYAIPHIPPNTFPPKTDSPAIKATCTNSSYITFCIPKGELELGWVEDLIFWDGTECEDFKLSKENCMSRPKGRNGECCPEWQSNSRVTDREHGL